jgi:hypothetical protein
MRKTNVCRNVSILLFGWASFAFVALAQGMRSQEIQVRNTGTGLWMLPNISYAGMRAQIATFFAVKKRKDRSRTGLTYPGSISGAALPRGGSDYLQIEVITYDLA